jgi:acyl-CoA reductase-like NAD-dependent aldehyde dehydrogenase
MEIYKLMVQVSNSSNIQCYCPATGEDLGRVTPATSNDIDTSISKASEAQKLWATSTFSERRKVLQTLLK